MAEISLDDYVWYLASFAPAPLSEGQRLRLRELLSQPRMDGWDLYELYVMIGPDLRQGPPLGPRDEVMDWIEQMAWSDPPIPMPPRPRDRGSRRTALYRYFDAADTLLYIGITYDPVERERSHRRESPWHPRTTRREVEWHSDRAAAGAAEIVAIEAERPLFNVRHSVLTGA